MTVLVDSSVWIDFGRGNTSPPVARLQDLMRSGDAGVTEPILMEVLAGAADTATWRDTRALLTSFDWVPVDAVADLEGAALVYRNCRRGGVTPRGLLDCLIVSICLRAGVSLLTADADFRRIATVTPLRLDGAVPVSPPGA